jgi:hypothetical protein
MTADMKVLSDGNFQSDTCRVFLSAELHNLSTKAHLEPIARMEDSSLYSRHIAEARFDHPLHYHPVIEITAITRSSGICVVGGLHEDF